MEIIVWIFRVKKVASAFSTESMQGGRSQHFEQSRPCFLDHDRIQRPHRLPKLLVSAVEWAGLADSTCSSISIRMICRYLLPQCYTVLAHKMGAPSTGVFG